MRILLGFANKRLRVTRITSRHIVLARAYIRTRPDYSAFFERSCVGSRKKRNVICTLVRSIQQITGGDLAFHRKNCILLRGRSFEIQCLLPRLCEMGPREARMSEREKLQQAQEIQRELNDKGLSRRAFLDRLKVLGVGFGAAAMLGVRDADA